MVPKWGFTITHYRKSLHWIGEVRRGHLQLQQTTNTVYNLHGLWGTQPAANKQYRKLSNTTETAYTAADRVLAGYDEHICWDNRAYTRTSKLEARVGALNRALAETRDELDAALRQWRMRSAECDSERAQLKQQLSWFESLLHTERSRSVGSEETVAGLRRQIVGMQQAGTGHARADGKITATVSLFGSAK